MPANPLDEDVLRELGSEFSKRLRRGEKPTLQEYTTRFPAEHASQVEEYLTSVRRKVQVATKTTISKSSHTVEQKSVEPPRDFGRYRIERTLGEGGMGAVYLAHDSQLDRKVALKTPKFTKGSDPTTMQRFYREARSAATLQHPNICPVYDVGEIDGTHYISMAFIEGQPLSDLVRAEKQPPVASLLKVVRKVALALHEAHRQGLIHRDLKPANIMIDRRSEPIVMDFGLARQYGDEQGESDAAPEATAEQLSQKVEARITMPGTVMGSPGYMAPEQLQGDQSQIGPASDVYAMGVLLYELLTGELPFPGTGTLISVVNSVISDPPPDATVKRSGLDPRIAEICRRAMSKRVADRYESMQAFAAALTKVLKSDSGKPIESGRALSPELVRQKEQYELAKSLLQEGQFAGAVSIMEKMVAGSESSQFTSWANDNIAEARIKADDAALAAATGDVGDDLWSADDPSRLPPRRKRSRSKRKRRKSLISALLTITIAATVLVAAAWGVRSLLLKNSSQADEPNTDTNAETLSQSPTTRPGNMEPDNTEPDNTPEPPEQTTPSRREPDQPDNRPPGNDGPGGDPSRPQPPNRRNNLLRDRLAQLDTDGNGKLSRDELRAARGPANAMVKRLLDEFDRLDGNKDNALDFPELERASQRSQPPGGRPFRRGPDRRRQGETPQPPSEAPTEPDRG